MEIRKMLPTSNELKQLKTSNQQLETRVAQLLEKIEQMEQFNKQHQDQLFEEWSSYKKIQDPIERGKREWEASLDAVTDMVILTDGSGRVIRCNASTCRYLDNTFTGLINRSIDELFFGSQPGCMHVFNTESVEVQFPHREGWFHVANFRVTLKDSAGSSVHVIKDITSHRIAQERLRENEEKLRRTNDELETRVGLRTLELFKTNQTLEKEIKIREAVQDNLAKEKELLSITLLSIQDGVISTDKDGIILLYNRAAELITGLPQQQAIGKPIQEVVRILDEKTNQVCAEPLFNLIHQPANNPLGHLTLLNHNREKILISSSSAPVYQEDGTLVGYVMVIDNITEQKRIESQILLSQKMESIGLMAAGIAHEINTPMQFVGDNTHFFREAFEAFIEMEKNLKEIDPLNPSADDTQVAIKKIYELKQNLDLDFYISEVPSAIQQTLDGIDRVRKIVLAMKAFSHPGQREKRPSDINQGIDNTVTISRNQWKYIADLETQLAPDLPLVHCEINEINQVLLNMIINSTQAIEEAKAKGKTGQGKITIKTRAVGEDVEISIQDSGLGIPADILNRIFDPFFTTKALGVGTGQGLSLAHNIIVNQHKGSIQVESEPDQSTTFIIRLPVHPKEKLDMEGNA